MNCTVENSTLIYGSLALAEGLDFPCPELVLLTPENRLLQYMTPLADMEDHWKMLTEWMQGLPTPAERLDALQRAYYQMFLQSGTDLFTYLHRWYPKESSAAFLSRFQKSVHEFGLEQSYQWPNGNDHLSVVFELLAHLAATQHPGLLPFIDTYLRPWFPTFAQRLKIRAANDYYFVISVIASEVDHAMETIS
jgi:TorA maturation chaperone TorD